MAKPQKAVKRLETVVQKRDGPHPIDVHVGSRIKLRRMILGLSQESLGKALGLTFQQIQKYEKGVNRIGASRIFEMSQLLEVPVQFFYDDLGDGGWGGASGFAEPDQRDGVMDLFNSAEGVQLCRYFAAIKDGEVKKRVLDLVKSIAENESS
jgi:transcriptional regulator with XRE-family HTH domain